MPFDSRRLLKCWIKIGFASLVFLSVILLFYVADVLPFKANWNNNSSQNEFVPQVNIPPLEELQKMEHKELAELYHRYINTVQVLCRRIVRIGNLGEGGWEICEDTDFRPSQPCLVYSFGIDNDFSFDDHIANRFNCEVHSFDPSMKIAESKRGNKMWYHKVGLSDRLETLGNDWNVKPLNKLMESLGHSKTKIDIMKIDIEKYEWQTLVQIFESGGLNNVKQLVMELHIAIAGEPEKFEYYKGLHVLKSLYDHGFRIHYTHRNLWCKFLSAFPDIDEVGCHEVSFVYIP